MKKTTPRRVPDDRLIALYNRFYPEDHIAPGEERDCASHRKTLASIRAIGAAKSLLDALKVMARDEWIAESDLHDVHDDDLAGYVRWARAVRRAFGAKDGPLARVRCEGTGVEPKRRRRA